MIIRIVLAFLVFLASPAFAEKLKFKSYEPGDHQAVFSGNWKTNGFKGAAEIVKAADPQAPMVVYAPGWGGADKYRPAFKDIRKKLGKKYHHLFLNPPKYVETTGRTITIFEAIKATQNTGLMPSEIFIVGASGGGQEAIHTTHKKIADALSEGIVIDGVVAFYPSCRVQFNDKDFNSNSKILIFVGGEDKTSPATLCDDFISNGGLSHARIQLYPDAGHSWLLKYKASVSKKSTWGECVLDVDETGIWRFGNIDSATMGEADFIAAMDEACSHKEPMLTGRNKAVYKDTVSKAVDFISTNTTN